MRQQPEEKWRSGEYGRLWRSRVSREVWSLAGKGRNPAARRWGTPQGWSCAVRQEWQETSGQSEEAEDPTAPVINEGVWGSRSHHSVQLWASDVRHVWPVDITVSAERPEDSPYSTKPSAQGFRKRCTRWAGPAPFRVEGRGWGRGARGQGGGEAE